MGEKAMPPNLNIQPMHAECNTRMASSYPMVPLIQHCDCCEYWYLAKMSRNNMANAALQRYERTGKTVTFDGNHVFVNGILAGPELPHDYPVGALFNLLAPSSYGSDHPEWVWYPTEWRVVLPSDYEDGWPWSPDEIGLMRCTTWGDGNALHEIRGAQVVGKVVFGNLSTPAVAAFMGRRRDGVLHAGLVDNQRIGNVLTIPHMVHHNITRHSRPPAFLSSDPQLSIDEERALASLQWGASWGDGGWLERDFDEFGIFAAKDGSPYAAKHPGLTSSAHIQMNAACRERIRVIDRSGNRIALPLRNMPRQAPTEIKCFLPR